MKKLHLIVVFLILAIALMTAACFLPEAVEGSTAFTETGSETDSQIEAETGTVTDTGMEAETDHAGETEIDRVTVVETDDLPEGLTRIELPAADPVYESRKSH